MPISATLSISSGVTGTLLSVEFQQLGRVEIKLSQKPRKHCIYGHRFPSYKCFWQVPRSRKLKNFKPRELPLHFAYGKDAEDRSLSNLSEDTDEMFDELFKKYGKVVFRGNDQKLPSAEVDDDVESLSYPLLVKAAKGHLVSRPPAWMMRQAGRYMAVYRKLAEKHPSFRERSETTDLIVQISLQPWEAFRPDGVIVFSDILTPLPAFVVPFDIDEMKGPVIQSPICLEEDLKALHPLDLEKLQFVGESLKILRKEVGDYAAVLGFVGAPWTIATYIIEGSTTRTYTTIKSMCHTAPHILRALLSHLTKAISEYIIFQVESGAHCIQIFDSWGGQLPPHMWELWSEPYIKEIVSLVRTKCPDTPLVLYINGNGGLLEQMKGTGVDVIGLDWTVDMADGRKRLGSDISVQGNVDPAFLFTPLPALTDEIRRVVKCAGPKGHILNLEHGVLVGTPEEAVAHFFEVVKSLKYNSSSQSLEESKLVV